MVVAGKDFIIRLNGALAGTELGNNGHIYEKFNW
jgi:hypothetical protein